jgi:hypothetical protein
MSRANVESVNYALDRVLRQPRLAIAAVDVDGGAIWPEVLPVLLDPVDLLLIVGPLYLSSLKEILRV